MKNEDFFQCVKSFNSIFKFRTWIPYVLYIDCECYIFWLFISPSKSKYVYVQLFFYFQAQCCYTPFISERKRTKNTVAKVHFKQVRKVNFFVVIHLKGSLTTNVRRRGGGGVVKNRLKV